MTCEQPFKRTEITSAILFWKCTQSESMSRTESCLAFWQVSSAWLFYLTLFEASSCQKTTCECDVKLVNELVANVDSFDQSRVLGYSFDQKRHCRRSSKGKSLAQEAEQPQNDSMFRMELESLAFDDNNEKKTQQETTSQSQARPNRSEKIDKKRFNNSLKRKLTFNSRQDADICCGEFPNVKSFNSFGGRRACCAK